MYPRYIVTTIEYKTYTVKSIIQTNWRVIAIIASWLYRKSAQEVRVFDGKEFQLIRLYENGNRII